MRILKKFDLPFCNFDETRYPEVFEVAGFKYDVRISKPKMAGSNLKFHILPLHIIPAYCFSLWNRMLESETWYFNLKFNETCVIPETPIPSSLQFKFIRHLGPWNSIISRLSEPSCWNHPSALRDFFLMRCRHEKHSRHREGINFPRILIAR